LADQTIASVTTGGGANVYQSMTVHGASAFCFAAVCTAADYQAITNSANTVITNAQSNNNNSSGTVVGGSITLYPNYGSASAPASNGSMTYPASSASYSAKSSNFPNAAFSTAAVTWSVYLVAAFLVIVAVMSQ